MKRILFTIFVAFFVLSLSAALTTLFNSPESAYEWMFALSCALLSGIVLFILVALLLRDLIQTGDNSRRVDRRYRGSYSAHTQAGPGDIGRGKSGFMSPYAAVCRKRDRGFERNAMDGRTPAMPEMRSNTYVPGRKSLHNWQQGSTQSKSRDGYQNVNQRRE